MSDNLKNLNVAITFGVDAKEVTKVIKVISSCRTVEQINHTIDWIINLNIKRWSECTQEVVLILALNKYAELRMQYYKQKLTWRRCK